MKAIAKCNDLYLIEEDGGYGFIYNFTNKSTGYKHKVVSLLNKCYWEWLEIPIDIEKAVK